MKAFRNFHTEATSIRLIYLVCLVRLNFQSKSVLAAELFEENRLDSSDGSGSAAQVWTTSGNSELDSWNYWWSYSGVSGPAYWGLLNPNWLMCDKGRRQSPVNIETRSLIYDPHLGPLKIDNNLISGVLYNDGHSIVFNCSLAAAYKSLLLFASKNNSDSSVQMQTPNIEKSMNDNNDSVQNNLQLRYGINPEAPQGRADTSGVDLDDSEISRKRGRRVASIDDCSRGLTADEGLTRNCGDRNQLLALGSGSQIAGLQGSEKAPLPIAQQDASVFLSRRDLASSESLNAVGQEINEQVLADTAASSLLSGSNQQPLEEQIQAIQSRSLPKFSGAGLSYSYQLETMHLRFGPTPMESDEANGVQEESGQSGGEGASHHSSAGSEHRIDGRPFDGELQLFAYNWQLYKDFHEASSAPNGLLAISILISSQSATNNKTTTTETKKTTTSEKFQSLVDQAGESLKYQGQFLHVAEFSLLELFPEHSLDQYVTYEGSLTWPGCQESVTWLLLNRPLYLSKQSLDKLRTISANEITEAQASGTMIAGNTRPVQALNGRQLRTNISPPSVKSNGQETCSRLWTKYQYSIPTR